MRRPALPLRQQRRAFPGFVDEREIDEPPSVEVLEKEHPGRPAPGAAGADDGVAQPGERRAFREESPGGVEILGPGGHGRRRARGTDEDEPRLVAGFLEPPPRLQTDADGGFGGQAEETHGGVSAAAARKRPTRSGRRRPGAPAFI